MHVDVEHSGTAVLCVLCRTYDGEQAGREAGDEVFPGTGTHNGVMGSGHSGAVICRHHQTHLNELTRVTGQPAITHIPTKLTVPSLYKYVLLFFFFSFP